jgi:VWFA-related protein
MFNSAIRMFSKRFSTFILLPVLGIGLCAQEITHDVAVTLKLIQVYVMDSRGMPVTDLKKEEFLIRDNNTPRKLTEFEQRFLTAGSPDKKTLPERSGTGSAESVLKSMNRKFFLFFDLANNSTKGFSKAREAALYFIDTQLDPSDEVGLISFSMIKDLTLHEYLTTDHGLIRSAVLALGKEGLVGRVENFESALYRELSGESAVEASQASKAIKNWAPEHLRPNVDTLSSSARYEALVKREEHKKVTRNLISGLTGLSKAFSYIPGNKNLVFFSSGIPYSLIFGDDRQRFPMDTVLRNEYEEMLQEMSNANTAVFCMNTEPLSSDINVPTYYKGEKTLQKMAQYSGGKFLGNVQNYGEALETVQAFTGSYYVLGYYVDEAWDGGYHQIKVDVTRPGCRVFAQKGYYNPKPFSRYSKLEKKLHLVDLALSERSIQLNPASIHVSALPCPIAGGPGILLLAEIPGTLIQDRIKGNVEILFLVFDDRENIRDVRRQELDISGLKGREGLDYSLLSLSPGRYRFRAVMRDMESGACAAGQVETQIPEPVQGTLQLLPPLLLKTGQSPLFIRGYVPETERDKFPLLDHFPFDPWTQSPVLDTIPQGTTELNLCFHVNLTNVTSPVPEFTAYFVNVETGRGREIPLSILSTKKNNDRATLLAGIELPLLPAGKYALILEAPDGAGGSRSQTSVFFTIE